MYGAWHGSHNACYRSIETRARLHTMAPRVCNGDVGNDMNEQHTHHGYAVYEWETCSLLTFCTLQTKNIKTQIRDQVLHSTGMHG